MCTSSMRTLEKARRMREWCWAAPTRCRKRCPRARLRKKPRLRPSQKQRRRERREPSDGGILFAEDGAERILVCEFDERQRDGLGRRVESRGGAADRKSTRLNSSHVEISYAVFCLKK